jgi:hypothetical protein
MPNHASHPTGTGHARGSREDRGAARLRLGECVPYSHSIGSFGALEHDEHYRGFATHYTEPADVDVSTPEARAAAESPPAGETLSPLGKPNTMPYDLWR